MKKAVIFDLDGTLINSLPDISRAMNKALAHHGLPVHEERAYRLFTGDGVLNLCIRAVGDRQDMVEPVRAFYAREYAQNSRVLSAPYPGIVELLETLHAGGLKVCVLSNKDDPDTQEVIRYYFPGQEFAVIRGRLEGVPVKPDPTAARSILSALGLAPQECWYVGDTQTDMRTAQNAGLESVAVLWGFQTREEIAPGKPRHYVNTAEELAALLFS